MTPIETTAARNLAIVERGYRGAVEVAYFDVLYQLLELHRQLGGVDVLLRSDAVTYALEAPRPAALLIGAVTLTDLDDPRGDIRRLLELGVGVFVEEPDVTRLGLDRHRLRPEINVLTARSASERMAEYEQVVFF